ncbi:Rho-GTPase-activating 5 [Lecanosticta acicola]|uniref:Rho-GTPase-activating 5 n=1 Tax=Lecanosticta acicola TaxID=111012 RepID=A0AAI9EBV6_9PEZI|nr:Rho-GTPase-activating 5 [Lecanosticta acicola]
MTTSGPSTAAAGAGGPKPAPHHHHHHQPSQSEAVKEKKDLASWWKNFKRSDKKAENQALPQGIFGVPLQTSIRYANVAISLFNDDGQSYIYGYVPIVVAKCGVFLKEKATDVEGIFRLAGSEKRIKELRVAFDSPDRYGKGLDWTGYTVHDAANILRRYFNQLPEPIIPLEFYQKFRDPLRNHQAQAVGVIESQSPSEGEFDPEAAIKTYQALITELPPLNRQLLLYILDLLAVFASKSDLNKMTTTNLAAIFQPGILNHPQHDMAPQEYRLSQDVLIFLIENQDSFLIGMQGTAADPETVREVQSGTPPKPPTTPTTPNRAKTVIGRSGSNSSVAAESVRKWGSIRRNVSVSSKHSKRSESGPAPGSPAPATPTSGVQRSNTVPSRRGESNAQSPQLSRDKNSDPSTSNASSAGAQVVSSQAAAAPIVETTLQRPWTAGNHSSVQNTPTTTTAPQFPAPPEITSASSSEATTPLAAVGSDTSVAATRDYQTPKKDTVPLLAPGASHERPADRSVPHASSALAGHKGFLDILKTSPGSDGERRKPNKLQKKRIPGSALSSAQSSSQSLHEDSLETQRSPQSPTIATVAQIPAPGASEARGEHTERGDQSTYATAQNTPTAQATPSQLPTDNTTLRPTVSPSNSFQSHTDMSDADLVGDDMPPLGDEQERKKRRWRFSRTQNKMEQPSTPGNPLGTMTAKDQAMSKSTIGSGGSLPRKSMQEPIQIASVATDPAVGGPVHSQTMQSSNTADTVFSDSERERKGPMSWLRNKIQERKDKDVEKRSRTPDRAQGHERTRSKQDLPLSKEATPARGKSFEQPRGREGAFASQATVMPNTINPVGAQTITESSAGVSQRSGTANGSTPGKVPEVPLDAKVEPPRPEPAAKGGG